MKRSSIHKKKYSTVKYSGVRNDAFVETMPSEKSNYQVRVYTIPRDKASSIDDPIIKELDELALLPKGWDFGTGEAVSKVVINKSKQICSIARLLQHTIEVLPNSNGGIVLNLFKSSESDVFLEVTVNPDLTIDYVLEKGKGINYDILDEGQDVKLLKIQTILSKNLSLGCNWSEPLTLESSRWQSNVLAATVSPITMAGYQYSSLNVPE